MNGHAPHFDVADVRKVTFVACDGTFIFNMVILPTDQRHSMIVHKESG